MDVPDNPAEALERLLWTVTRSGQSTVSGGWTVTLNAHPGTPEFVSRHSAVVGLVRDIQTYLESLPDGDVLKERHLNDVPAYYDAVVYRNTWAANLDLQHGLVEPNVIRLLGSLGTTIRVTGRGVVMEDDDVAELKSGLGKWEHMLSTARLPDGLAEQIRVQLQLIKDLLDQASTLGYSPAIKEARGLFGLGMRALKQAQDIRDVVTSVVWLFEFITHLQLGDWGSAANTLTGAFSMMGDALDVARQTATQPLAIETSKQSALEAAPRSEAEGQQEIEAEIVEDESG